MIEMVPTTNVLTMVTDRKLLASFTSNVFSVALMVIGAIITLKFNTMSPRDVDKYVQDCIIKKLWFS